MSLSLLPSSRHQGGQGREAGLLFQISFTYFSLLCFLLFGFFPLVKRHLCFSHFLLLLLFIYCLCLFPLLYLLPLFQVPAFFPFLHLLQYHHFPLLCLPPLSDHFLVASPVSLPFPSLLLTLSSPPVPFCTQCSLLFLCTPLGVQTPLEWDPLVKDLMHVLKICPSSLHRLYLQAAGQSLVMCPVSLNLKQTTSMQLGTCYPSTHNSWAVQNR